MSYTPSELAIAIQRGLVKRAVEQTKAPVEVPREKMIQELGDWLRRENFDEQELNFLYQVLRNRFRQKNCYLCGKLKETFKGVLEWPDGDMSKPKKFVCADCKGIL